MSVPDPMFDDDGVEIPQQQIVAVGPAFVLDPHSLFNPTGRKPTFEECENAAKSLQKVHNSLAWWLGDLIGITESLFSEEASQIIDAENFSESTVRVYRYVAKQVPPKNRTYAQSFSHAQVVAPLKADEQRKWLERSRQEDWSVAKLKTELLASTEGCKSKLKFLLIVDAGTETRQGKLAETLEADGFKVIKKSAVKREKAEKKPKAKKREKKGPVTAKRLGGRTKMSASRRVPS
jgi:hypothetical protein